MLSPCLSGNQAFSSTSIKNNQVKDPQINVLSGNPETGKIEVFFQTHRIPDGGSLPSVRKNTGLYQSQMLKELIKSNPSVIFPEGTMDTIYPNDPKRGELLNAEEAKRLFPGGIKGLNKALENPTDEQLFFLEKHDAWSVYAAIVNPNVVIHSTTDEALEREVDADLSDANPDNDKHAIYDKRETRVEQEVNGYLKKNPGSKVVVIYGGNHKTLPQQLNVHGSEVTSYRWKSINNKNIYSRSEIVEEEKNPDIQLKLIKESKNLFDSTFHKILTEEGQLNALFKLDVDISYQYINTPEKFRDYLLNDARSDKVKNEINRLYRDFKKGLRGGPFDAFETFNASDRLFDSNDRKLQQKLIESGATFYEWSIPGDLSPNLQRMIYSKIVRGPTSREDLKKYLLEKITDKQTRDLIDKHYKSKSGPFA